MSEATYVLPLACVPTGDLTDALARGVYTPADIQAEIDRCEAQAALDDVRRQPGSGWRGLVTRPEVWQARIGELKAALA